MIIHPEEVQKLPKWATAIIGAFNKWAPKSVHHAIDDFMTEVVMRFELDERLPARVRHGVQAVSCWWTRLTIGEKEWAEWMREIAEDARQFGNAQEALAA